MIINLSPYEKDRIIPQSFGQTEMGRDLLAEDYMLKQITASLIYPEGETGKKFWKRIYEEAAKRFGTTNIPVNTFNKVWVIPDKAVVYENVKAGTAYVVESKLKVMLEQDYLSLEKHECRSGPCVRPQDGQGNVRADTRSAPTNDVNALGSKITREIIIPELTKEVNYGKNFAQLRQVYNSLILATWYKKKIGDSILAQVYEDKKKVAGVGYENSVVARSKTNDVELIYHRYLQAFKKGVYNYIKEEAIFIPGTPSKEHEVFPRKYFSGGFGFFDTAMHVKFISTMPAAISPAPFNYIVDMAMSDIPPNTESITVPTWGPATTVGDIINYKRALMDLIIKNKPIEPYRTTIALIKKLRNSVHSDQPGHPRRYKLGIGSSSTRAKEYLESFGIIDNFDAIVDGTMVRGNDNGTIPGKPSPEFFKEVATKLGVDPKDAIVFEDAISGVTSAKGGGFGLIIGLARNENQDQLRSAGADLVLTDIRKLSVGQLSVWFKEKHSDEDFKGVIFDVDGVISDSETQHMDSWEPALNGYLEYRESVDGRQYPRFTRKDYDIYFAGRSTEDVVNDFLDARGIKLRDTAQLTQVQLRSGDRAMKAEDSIGKFLNEKWKDVYHDIIATVYKLLDDEDEYQIYIKFKDKNGDDFIAQINLDGCRITAMPISFQRGKVERFDGKFMFKNLLLVINRFVLDEVKNPGQNGPDNNINYFTTPIEHDNVGAADFYTDFFKTYGVDNANKGSDGAKAVQFFLTGDFWKLLEEENDGGEHGSQGQLDSRNHAMRAEELENGGIDFTAARTNVQISNGSPTKTWGDGKGGIQFHLDPAMFAQLQSASGFFPRVVSVRALGDLQEFLDDKNENVPPASVAR